MENKYTSIAFKAKVKPIKNINPEFDLVKIYVQGIGKNRNGSYMSKENIIKYRNTLNYCPVVGHLFEYVDENGEKNLAMGGHDWAITENWEFKDLTVPYGVIINDSFDFEMVDEYGAEVEYMTAQAYLWTGRYPELKDAIYADDFWFNQSMEINVEQYRPLEEDSNYTELLEWTYSACCLLGKADDKDSPAHTEPCFISARVVPVEFSKSEFAEAMDEMREKLEFCFQNQPSTKEVDIDNDNGGSAMTKDFETEVVEPVTEPEVEGAVEEPTVEEPTVEEATVEEPVVEEPVVEPTDPVDPDVEPTVDPEPVIEDSTEEPVVEGSAEDYGVLYNELKEEYDALVAEFNAYKENHSFLNSDYEALESYRADREASDREAAENELFASYEDVIGETSEFVALKEKSSEYSIEELKKECLCIVGMYSMTKKNKEVKKNESIKFSFNSNNDVDDEPYGGIHKKYLNR